MTGEFQHSIDAKGRLFIPARLREELGSAFHVTVGIDKCLSIYPAEMWDRITAKAEALPLSESRKLRFFFSNASRCELDAQGRILIPVKLREYANLTKDATVIGVSSYAEIWDTAAYKQMEDENLSPEYLEDVMSTLSF